MHTWWEVGRLCPCGRIGGWRAPLVGWGSWAEPEGKEPGWPPHRWHRLVWAQDLVPPSLFVTLLKALSLDSLHFLPCKRG